jgi:hypothetical protein
MIVRAAFINLFLNDAEAAKAYRSDNGAVSSQALLQAQIDDPESPAPLIAQLKFQQHLVGGGFVKADPVSGRILRPPAADLDDVPERRLRADDHSSGGGRLLQSGQRHSQQIGPRRWTHQPGPSHARSPGGPAWRG